MPTSCNTHDYDGKLREKWFQMRPMLIEKYLPRCLSFDDTIKEMEKWLDEKYYNVKRITRARRSINILTSQRRSNFDSRNDINVEELLPILWDQVKNQEDIHNTFYEQLCDITGGSCSQGRSTRLFQFLFLFDLPSEPPSTTTSKTEEWKKKEIVTEPESIIKCVPPKTTLVSTSNKNRQLPEESESRTEQKLQNEQQLHIDEESHVEKKTEGEKQLQENEETQKEAEPSEHPTKSSSNKVE